MGIFSRLKDIVNSNVNAMLEKAEDPEKLVKLMIQEMEDTLIEIKAGCAGSMAQARKLERMAGDVAAKVEEWRRKAELALSKERDDLAREALREKKAMQERADSLQRELTETRGLVAQYQEDISQIEGKLAAAREKQRLLVQRHRHARERKRVQTGIRKVETTDAFARFEQFEQRIDRMEADANLVNYGRKPSLEDEFRALEHDDEIEEELRGMKERRKA